MKSEQHDPKRLAEVMRSVIELVYAARDVREMMSRPPGGKDMRDIARVFARLHLALEPFSDLPNVKVSHEAGEKGATKSLREICQDLLAACPDKKLPEVQTFLKSL
jgi:hypothetical protein